MNDLNAIVSTFSHEEQERFIAYLGKKNKRKDTKNIQLFKILLDKEIESKEICLKIYENKKTNAYHALRKRLYQSIVDFIASASLQEENSADMYIIKYILASRKCLIHKQYKVAFNILNKAELLAKEKHLFPLLNEIYHTQIQYAHTNTSMSLNDTILKFKQNQKNYYLEDELNIVYAKVRLTLNQITHNSAIIDFQNILTDIFKVHNISINESMSFKSLYQLMSIVGFSAFATNNYLKTEPFLLSTYGLIINHQNKEKSVFYHIHILYLIANTLFRNKKFTESQHYLKLMHEEMLSHKKKYYNSFKLKYHLLLTLNLNYSNQQHKAISLLKPFIGIKHDDTESLLDIQLSFITYLFQKQHLKEAYSELAKLYHTDKWYIEKIGIEWVIKKNLLEILLLIDLKKVDLVESRMLSFRRNYFKYLRNINQQRVITYLALVESYYKSPETVTFETFKNKVKNAFDWIETYKEDIFVISFFSWLKGKINKTDLYQTTLQLVNVEKQ